MEKRRLLNLLNAASGLTYAEWRIACQEIERGFQEKMNREMLTSDDAERIGARMEIELDAYFREG
jgi:hypothetical protein